MKSPVVELNSLLKFFSLSSGLKTTNYYRRNVYLKLSQESTTHYLNYYKRCSKEDNTIYCMNFSFLVKIKNYFT